MINTLPPSAVSDYPAHHTGSACLTPHGKFTALAGIPALLTPYIASAAHHSSVLGTESTPLFLILFAAGIIAISAILIIGITSWGHKQDQIQSMMPFCIRYLAKSKNEVEKISAAKVLGRARHPAALLILTDIVNDETAGEKLRSAALESLRGMSRNYQKYANLIDEFLSAVEANAHQKIIDLLITHFENGGTRHVQSAYVIGREYIRLGNPEEARVWLQKAKKRNMRAHVYVNQISQLISACTRNLIDAGDALFRGGRYHEALGRYALASHDLGLEQKRLYLAHLRLACTYCKLERYEDAYQETLLALQDQHKTDTLLPLNKLLQERLGKNGGSEETKMRRDRISAEIATLADSAMAEVI